MARMSMAPRILGLFFLILALVFGGIFWLDYLGVINAGGFLSPIYRLFGARAEVEVNADDPNLLDAQRLRKQEESLDLRFQDLQNKTDAQAKLEQDFSQRASTLAEREKAQDDREKSFNDKVKQYDGYNVNLVQNSKYLTSMRPDAAVEILKNYEDQVLIDTMRVTEQLAAQAGTPSLVPIWLSKMDPKRAAEIQRKMAIKPASP